MKALQLKNPSGSPKKHKSTKDSTWIGYGVASNDNREVLTASHYSQDTDETYYHVGANGYVLHGIRYSGQFPDNKRPLNYKGKPRNKPDGRFPDFMCLIPKKSDYVVWCDPVALYNALAIASVFSRDNANSVALHFNMITENNESYIMVVGKSAERGDCATIVPCDVSSSESANFSWSVNYDYLAKALKGFFSDGIVKLSLNSSESPMLIGDSNQKFALIMPLCRDDNQTSAFTESLKEVDIFIPFPAILNGNKAIDNPLCNDTNGMDKTKAQNYARHEQRTNPDNPYCKLINSDRGIELDLTNGDYEMSINVTENKRGTKGIIEDNKITFHIPMPIGTKWKLQTRHLDNELEHHMRMVKNSYLLNEREQAIDKLNQDYIDIEQNGFKTQRAYAYILNPDNWGVHYDRYYTCKEARRQLTPSLTGKRTESWVGHRRNIDSVQRIIDHLHNMA